MRHSGLALGLLVWAVCSGSLALAEWRQVMHRPALYYGKALIGATAPVEQVAWSWDSFVHGRVQATASRTVGQALPLFALAVRLRNQVEWTLLHTAATTGLMLGRNGMLVEMGYATEYCSRNVAASRQAAVEWAGRIRQMQDITERRGHAFLYVLTPSKVAQYPELLPASFTCPASAADRVGLVPAWLAILHDAGVHVADTTAPVMVAHADYPFRLFAPSGAHWNSVGQAVGMRPVVAAMIQLLPGRDIAPLSFSWTMSRHPIPPDNDLVGLANLLSEPDDPSPNAIADNEVVSGPCHPPQVVIVGGSFSQQILVWLSRLPCSVPVVLYDYWKIVRLSAGGRDIFGSAPVDADERDRRVLDADLLIYEENEQVLGTQNHGTALWQMLREKGAEAVRP